MSNARRLSLWSRAPQDVLITGIGSLPHHNVDAALNYSLRLNVPFLPQIPVRNPREYMIHQALEGMPGLEPGERGEVRLNREVWEKESPSVREKLDQAFGAKDDHTKAFEAFEPSLENWSGWRPFLFEVEEKQLPFVKIQLAGPMTSQWSLKLTDDTPTDRYPEIETFVFRLVLARAIAMTRKVHSQGATPLFYIDEPGFYCFSRQSARHLMGLQELKLFIQTLKKEGALVGLHCCSNTDWKSVISLNLDVLSLDTTLSLKALLKNSEEVRAFLLDGGRLSLGVIPTGKDFDTLESFDPAAAFEALIGEFEANRFDEPKLLKAIVRDSIYTPACGLALHRIEDAEIILSYLVEIQDLARAYH